MFDILSPFLLQRGSTIKTWFPILYFCGSPTIYSYSIPNTPYPLWNKKIISYCLCQSGGTVLSYEFFILTEVYYCVLWVPSKYYHIFIHSISITYLRIALKKFLLEWLRTISILHLIECCCILLLNYYSFVHVYFCVSAREQKFKNSIHRLIKKPRYIFWTQCNEKYLGRKTWKLWVLTCSLERADCR